MKKLKYHLLIHQEMTFGAQTGTRTIKKILACLLFLHAINTHAQTSTADSLQQLLEVAKEDTIKVNLLLALGKEFRYADTDTSLYFANRALILAGNLHYEPGIADAKKGVSALYASQGRFQEGINYGNEALAIYEKLYAAARAPDKAKYLDQIGRTHLIIGHNLISQGNYPEGLKNTLLALKIKEQLGDKKGTGETQYNLGNLYATQQNYEEALKYYAASQKIFEELGIKSYVAIGYNTIGWVRIQQNNYPEALKQCSIALALATEIDDRSTLAEIYNNLAVINDNSGNYEEAIKQNLAAMKLYEATGTYQQLPWIYTNTARVYIKQKKYDMASVYADKALSFSKKSNSFEHLRLAYQAQAAIDSARGDFKNALEHYKLAIACSDSLVNEENTKKIVQQQMQYEFDKRQDSIKAQQDKKDALAAAQIKNQKLVRNFSITGAVAIVGFGGVSFYRYRRRRKLQSRQEMLNERLRISRELHDDIGSTLGSISIYSEVAKNRAEKNQDPDEAISKIDFASRELIEKMSDIVWSIHPDNESFEQLQNRMQTFAAMILTPRNIENNFIVDEGLKQTQLTTEERKNVFLIFKEAVYNIVKYAECSAVEIKLFHQRNVLEMVITDNGKGFESTGENSLGGNGLKNMKARADDIGASLSIISIINEGTTIKVLLDL